MAGRDFFGLPIGARVDPTLTGELPGPVQRDAAGNIFQAYQQMRAAQEWPQAQGMGGVMGAMLPMGDWRGLAQGIWEGLQTPGKAAQGEMVTHGDAFGTGLDAMGGGAFGTAPKGALRAGPIRAYHGSPHDFDKFSMDKIGTGEGAQAYGHGLYFAEAEDVARAYRDRLSTFDAYGSRRPNIATVDGVPAKELGQDVWEVADQIASGGYTDVDDLIAGLRSKLQATKNPSRADVWQDLLSQAEGVADKMRGKTVKFDNGRMYEVNINADPDDFLDWDAPLREQKQIAEKLGLDPYARVRRAEQIAEDVKADMSSAGRTDPDEVDLQNLALAEDLLQQHTFESASSYAPRSTDMAQELQRKGIPGIKYRDQGSRGGVDGAEATRNYVVFDDNLVSIIRKYGIAAAAPMLGLTAEELQRQMTEQGI